jgi:hypothetical protein
LPCISTGNISDDDRVSLFATAAGEGLFESLDLVLVFGEFGLLVALLGVE